MTEPLSRETASELRHELRTPVNHIVGYAEMLREDAPGDSSTAARLDRILALSREVLDKINAALPPTGVATHGDLTRLLESLRDPQRQILEATIMLRRDSTDSQFAVDVGKIAEAAKRLTEPPQARSIVVPEPAPAASQTSAVLHASAGGQARGRILIVDDVEENRAVLARRLDREGYHVSSAASGEDALREIANGGYDLVLLDVLMPGMDGFAVLERIKGDAKTRSIPVIMISALDDLSSVVRCIEHGAEDYLAKPFDPVLLRARIGASLEKKRWHDREADYLRQVNRVIEAAAAVEHGTYASGNLGAISARDDELGRLARVFDAMAAGVRARETKLREQLRELRADVTLATNEFEATHATAANEAADVLKVGTVLSNRYELLSVVGRGGMGVVYRALDRELNEHVALKAIRQEHLADSAAAERFKTEIRLARRISHRNVVRTHDLGEAEGMLFVTMEYVNGIDVRELLTTRGKLGVASSLALARQFAEALAVAHAAGVIHRDVKPENALIDGEGALKVMDFGIARLAEATSSRTQAGLILGTPAYMAPEQLLGEEIDARADLYALGVVMYECLTGKAPFSAPSVAALIGKVLTTDAPSPVSLSPDVPPAVSGLVMRLLSKSRDERPGTASQLIEALTELA
jgi:DNA-binding response OmpR family regulator